jgi:hypothetical protein
MDATIKTYKLELNWEQMTLLLGMAGAGLSIIKKEDYNSMATHVARLGMRYPKDYIQLCKLVFDLSKTLEKDIPNDAP